MRKQIFYLLLLGIPAIAPPGLGAWETKERATIKHPELITAIVFSPDGKTLALGGRLTEGTVVLWDVATGKKRTTLYRADSHMAFSPDSKTLAVIRGTWAKIYDAGTDRPRLVIDAHNGKATFAGHDIWSLAFGPDGKTLALATADEADIGFVGQIKLCDPVNGKILRTLQGSREGVKSVAFTPDGKTLASTDRLGDELRLWDMETGRVRVSVPRFASQMALSGDGKILAATKTDGTGLIKVWDVATGKEVGEPMTHLGTQTLALSPDGKLLASGGGRDRQPGEIKLWQVGTGKELVALKGHSGVVWAVAFSPDGKTLVSGGDDGIAKLWDVPRLLQPKEGK